MQIELKNQTQQLKHTIVVIHTLRFRSASSAASLRLRSSSAANAAASSAYVNESMNDYDL